MSHTFCTDEEVSSSRCFSPAPVGVERLDSFAQGDVLLIGNCADRRGNIGQPQPHSGGTNGAVTSSFYDHSHIPSAKLHLREQLISPEEGSKQTFGLSSSSHCIKEALSPQQSVSIIDNPLIRLQSNSADSYNSGGKDTDSNCSAGNSTLDSLDFNENTDHGKWEARFHELLEYRAKFGHCNVPYNFQEKPFLYSWVRRQRHQHKLLHQGRGSHLMGERVRLLESIGFAWDTHALAWEVNYELLETYVQRVGHCHIPAREKRLFAWAKRQRRHYRRWTVGQDSTMTEDRFRRLTKLGFRLSDSASSTAATPTTK